MTDRKIMETKGTSQQVRKRGFFRHFKLPNDNKMKSKTNFPNAVTVNSDLSATLRLQEPIIKC